MNHHLNIFRFFNENNSVEFIENNLSRAFSISLLNSSILFNDFLKNIISEEDYNYLFSVFNNEDALFEIDLQIDTDYIDRDAFNKVYAIALTEHRLNMDDFFQQNHVKKQNLTDIVISIKDILIVIEVKKYDHDCKWQLFNQIYPFIKDDSFNNKITPKSISWSEVVALFEKVNNVGRLTNSESPFLRDFLKYASYHRPNWFNPKPFNTVKFSTTGQNAYIITQRLKQALSNCKYPLLDYSDRLGVAVPFHWASEIIPHLYHYENRPLKDYIGFCIWPGNTKTQGYSVYNKPLEWVKKNNLKINGRDYELEIVYDLKFSHFNKYLTNFQYSENDVQEVFHSNKYFHYFSGKWNINQWSEFEEFLDSKFKKEFDWRSKCNWENKLVNTDRTYFTVSFGYEVCVFIPYGEFMELDKKDNDIEKVTNFVNSIMDSLQNLLN